MGHLQDQPQMSERLACRVTGKTRSTQRFVRKVGTEDEEQRRALQRIS